MLKISDLLKELNDIAPFSDSESWDNTGLLVGNMDDNVTGIITALDCSLETVEEAVIKKANVIISHHPLIFPNASKVVNEGAGKVIRKLIKEDINMIAMHTNLDHQSNGVSHMIAEALGFHETEILLPRTGNFKKLRVNINAEAKDEFKENLLKYSPAGTMGEYTEVSYEYEVKGQFIPGEAAEPAIGKAGQKEHVDEFVIECMFDGKDQQSVIDAVMQYHPYEVPAYDILSLDKASETGLGVKFNYGDTLESLTELIRVKTGINIVNTVKGNDDIIQTAAVIGGSGMSYADDVFNSGADVLITGDVKYHEAYDAKAAGFNIIDAGHYLEVIMKQGLAELVAQKTDVPVEASTISTNPFE